jgi:hypothetical protein
MSCQRCGGVLAAELAASMYELVCGRVVVENRYCHCDDVQSPVQAYPPREGEGTLVEGVPAITTSEGGIPQSPMGTACEWSMTTRDRARL